MCVYLSLCTCVLMHSMRNALTFPVEPATSLCSLCREELSERQVVQGRAHSLSEHIICSYSCMYTYVQYRNLSVGERWPVLSHTRPSQRPKLVLYLEAIKHFTVTTTELLCSFADLIWNDYTLVDQVKLTRRMLYCVQC